MSRLKKLMGNHKELFSNRGLLHVSLLFPFRDLKITCTSLYANQTLEKLIRRKNALTI